jgi:DtxR family Mn-dependent transcriptional regulator
VATSTVENYIKQLYLLGQEKPRKPVLMGELARTMRVVPGTATTMVKAMARAGLVRHTPRVGARLTPSGERLALQMLRKHRLIEMFLVQTLGLDWSEIHDEAELLEHALSDRLVERLDAFLGHPRVDPHGDPIPSAAGRMPAHAALPLADLPAGAGATLARITRQDAEFLRFLHEAGLHPGRRLKLTRRDPVADLLVITLADGREVSLGGKAARHLLVAQSRMGNKKTK